MKRGLVLGGGGLVGMGYHAGALKALDEWGVDLASTEVVVGTSAGSVLASYLRAGWTADDFFDYAHGRHRDSATEGPAQEEEVRALFEPMWSSPVERIRRGVGSTFAMLSSRGWIPGGGRVPAPPLRRLFPSGLYSTEGTRARFGADLPRQWPAKPTYICAAELYSGRRVAFGAPGAPPAPFCDAVLASTSIPGVFPPVRIGDHYYVDGGVVSATSLDLAVQAGCESILCIAPLGYKRDIAMPAYDPRAWGPVLTRTPFARVLRGEVGAARAAGVDVLVIRPWLSDLRAHGTNSMRHFDRSSLVDSARAGTLRLLEQIADHPVLQATARSASRRARKDA